MIPNPKTSTLTMAANAVVQSLTLPVGGGLVLSVFNRGPQDAFFELGPDANVPCTAPSGNTAGSMFIAANQPATQVTLRATDTTFLAVSAGNSTLYLTRGKDKA